MVRTVGRIGGFMARQMVVTAVFGEKPKAAEERRRKKFIREAKKAKKAWFLNSFRASKAAWQKKGIVSKRLGAAIWLIFGAAAVAASGCVAFYTGKMQVFGTETKFDPKAGEWKKEMDKPEFFGSADEADGWEQEFFGLHIRFQEGQITIFRENERIIQERDEDIH